MRAGGRTTRRMSRRAVLRRGRGWSRADRRRVPTRSAVPRRPRRPPPAIDVHGPIDVPRGVRWTRPPSFPTARSTAPRTGRSTPWSGSRAPVLATPAAPSRSPTRASSGTRRSSPLASFSGPVATVELRAVLVPLPHRRRSHRPGEPSGRDRGVRRGDGGRPLGAPLAARRATGSAVGVDAGTGALYDVSAKPALDRWEPTDWNPLSRGGHAPRGSPRSGSTGAPWP